MMHKYKVVLSCGTIGLAFAYWLNVGDEVTVKTAEGERVKGVISSIKDVN